MVAVAAPSAVVSVSAALELLTGCCQRIKGLESLCNPCFGSIGLVAEPAHIQMKYIIYIYICIYIYIFPYSYEPPISRAAAGAAEDASAAACGGPGADTESFITAFG